MKRLIHLTFILMTLAIIAALPAVVYGDTKVITATSEDAYGKGVADLVKKYTSSTISAKAANDPYQTMRLIVKGKKRLTFDQFKATEVLEGPEYRYLVQFSSVSAAKEADEKLNSLPSVSWSEPDAIIKAYDGDTESSKHSVNIASYSWGVAHINAANCAKYVKGRTTKSIVVAVVDSGVSPHSFIKSRIQSGGYDYIDGDSDPSDVSGGTGHGTHVAGTIVDCTPGLSVKILPVRVLGKNGSGTMSIGASGIRYAADHGAKVINLSLGGPASNDMDSAVNYAINKGVVVVCAAGNDNKNTSSVSPARNSKAIVVSAIDSSDQKAYFSNYGNSIDVAAPGVNIKSCVPGGGYESWSGTSMACPHAAAVAAMYRLAYPSKTPAEIEKLMRSKAKDIGVSGWDQYYGAGLVYAEVPKEPDEKPSGIELNKTSLAMKRGNTFKLVATVTAASATANTDVKWTTSDSDIAIVSGAGMVYAMKSGTATITATTVDGSKKATCTVKVTLSVTGGAVLKPLKSKTDYSSYDFTGDGVADKFRYNLDTAGKIVIKLNGKFTNLSTGSDSGLYYYKADRSNVFILEQTTVSWGTILRPYRYQGGKFVSAGNRIGIYDHTTIMSIAGGKLIVASGPVSMTKTNSFSGVYSEPFRFKESYKVNTSTHKIVLASRYATLWMKRIYYYAGSKAIKLSTSPTSWNSNGPKLSYGDAVQIHRVYYSGSTPAKGQKYYEVTVNGTKCWLRDSTDVPLVDSCDLVY